MTSPERPVEELTASTPLEIERKFLVSHLPENLDSYKHEEIRQGYLVIGKDGSEARVRERKATDGTSSYTMTVKSKGDLSRGEWETPISQEQFEILWPSTNGKRVEKIRFTIPTAEGAVIELDIYEGELMGLVSAEVEFDSIQSSSEFKVPDWFSAEVTDLKSMKNQQLAENGFPEEIYGTNRID